MVIPSRWLYREVPYSSRRPGSRTSFLVRLSPSLLAFVFSQCFFYSNSNAFRPLRTPNAPTRNLYIHRTKDQGGARTWTRYHSLRRRNPCRTRSWEDWWGRERATRWSCEGAQCGCKWVEVSTSWCSNWANYWMDTCQFHCHRLWARLGHRNWTSCYRSTSTRRACCYSCIPFYSCIGWGGGEHKDHLWWKRKRWKLRRIEYVFLSTQMSLDIN